MIATKCVLLSVVMSFVTLVEYDSHPLCGKDLIHVVKFAAHGFALWHFVHVRVKDVHVGDQLGK